METFNFATKGKNGIIWKNFIPWEFDHFLKNGIWTLLLTFLSTNISTNRWNIGSKKLAKTDLSK